MNPRRFPKISLVGLTNSPGVWICFLAWLWEWYLPGTSLSLEGTSGRQARTLQGEDVEISAWIWSTMCRLFHGEMIGLSAFPLPSLIHLSRRLAWVHRKWFDTFDVRGALDSLTNLDILLKISKTSVCQSNSLKSSSGFCPILPNHQKMRAPLWIKLYW
jgi:hypothetical protein